MTAPLLSLRNVRVSFGGLTALDVQEADVSAAPGISSVWIGPNGAGKTTLLNAVTGYARVRRPGEVVLLDQGRIQLGELSPAQVVKHGIARTFQTPCLFRSLSVGEVLWLADRFSRSTWGPGTNRAVLQKLIENVSSLLELDVAQPTATLSLATARRLDLGRALMSCPRLLFLDEPTAGLTADEKRSLLSVLALGLQQFLRNAQELGVSDGEAITVSLVTHDMGFLDDLFRAGLLDACTVNFMSLGKVALQGSLDAVMASRLVREEYLGV